MAQPKFCAGQRVSLSATVRQSAPSGVYRIVRPMPAGPGPMQYRVKGEAEAFERIVEEGHLQSLLSD